MVVNLSDPGAEQFLRCCPHIVFGKMLPQCHNFPDPIRK